MSVRIQKHNKVPERLQRPERPEQFERSEKNELEKQSDFEEHVLESVEKIIEKKMETIDMIIESKVNKKLREYKRWMGVTRTGFIPSNTVYKGTQVSSNGNDCAFSSSLNNVASVSTNKIAYANFGTENYRYISFNLICQFIKNITDFYAILQKIVKELYFNTAHKENNVIFIHPNAYKNITVFVDGMWRNFDQTYILESVVRRANDVLQHYMINSSSEEEMLKQEIGKRKFEHLQTFTDKIDNMEDFPEFRLKLMEDTEHTIVTNQHLVHPHIFEPETTPSTI